jgi:hypothetical protein
MNGQPFVATAALVGALARSLNLGALARAQNLAALARAFNRRGGP